MGTENGVIAFERIKRSIFPAGNYVFKVNNKNLVLVSLLLTLSR